MSDQPLTEKKCTPCQGGVEPFTKEQAQHFLNQTPLWELDTDANSIARTFVTKNFVSAVEFIERIKDIAEEDNHHPDLHLTGYRNLTVEISTHKIGGLSENDFILAAKIDQLPVELKEG